MKQRIKDLEAALTEAILTLKCAADCMDWDDDEERQDEIDRIERLHSVLSPNRTKKVSGWNRYKCCPNCRGSFAWTRPLDDKDICQWCKVTLREADKVSKENPV